MEDHRIYRKLAKVDTPSYVVDLKSLLKNLKALKEVKESTGCKILLALKAFSMHSTFPLVSRYLDGVSASGLNEARLGREEFRKEVHTYSAAYNENEFKEIVENSDYIIFNSVNQLEKLKDKAKDKKVGLRVNPEYSEVEVQLYNPCANKSRLGVKAEDLNEDSIRHVSGLHFHVMCEQNSDTLQRVLHRFEEKFGKYLHDLEWVNLGGGHHITREDYDIALLIKLINRIKEKYEVRVILEPGEAVALNAGFLVSSVLDIVDNDGKIAILDASAETHMPDVLAMPYRPFVIGSGMMGEKRFDYRLAGPSCLAGDVIGDYSFDSELKIGDKLVFTDMAIYTMVKNTTFNGINLPSIYLINEDGKIELVKSFGYKDFKERL